MFSDQFYIDSTIDSTQILKFVLLNMFKGNISNSLRYKNGPHRIIDYCKYISSSQISLVTSFNLHLEGNVIDFCLCSHLSSIKFAYLNYILLSKLTRCLDSQRQENQFLSLVSCGEDYLICSVIFNTISHYDQNAQQIHTPSDL